MMADGDNFEGWCIFVYEEDCKNFLFFVYVYMIRISAVNHSLDHEGHEVTVELQQIKKCNHLFH